VHPSIIEKDVQLREGTNARLLFVGTKRDNLERLLSCWCERKFPDHLLCHIAVLATTVKNYSDLSRSIRVNASARAVWRSTARSEPTQSDVD
jgi:hypothetical protein